MKLKVEGNHLLVVEAMPVELAALKDALTWEDREGRKRSAVKGDDENGWWTYRHLKEQIVERLSDVMDIAVEVPIREPLPPVAVRADCLNGITLREHQVMAIKKALRGEEGTLSLPTGAGKTEIILGLFQCVQPRQCVVMVPTLYLSEEIRKRAIKYGIPDSEIGVLSGESKQLKRLTIAVVDSLHSALEKGDQFAKALKSCDLLMCDEGHHLGAATWRECWLYSDARRKVAVTATPYNNVEGDPLATLEDCLVLATAGPILYSVSNQYLIEAGIVAKTYCLYLNVPGKKPFYPISPTKLHTEQVQENPVRNRLIIEAVQKARAYDMAVLVLVGRTEHARKLMEMLPNEKVICKFEGGTSLQRDELTGEVERQQVTLTGPGSWVERFENGEWDVIIGTPNMDEGVDIPMIDFTVFGGGGKTVRRNIQRRGRGSRRKPFSMNVSFMIDFVDRQHVYLWHHSRKRQAVFVSTGTELVDDKLRFWRLVNMYARSKEEK